MGRNKGSWGSEHSLEGPEGKVQFCFEIPERSFSSSSIVQECLEIRWKPTHFCILNFFLLNSFCLRSNIKHSTQHFITRWNTSTFVKNIPLRRRSFNSVLSVSSGDETLCLMLDILHEILPQIPFPRKGGSDPAFPSDPFHSLHFLWESSMPNFCQRHPEYRFLSQSPPIRSVPAFWQIPHPVKPIIPLT